METTFIAWQYYPPSDYYFKTCYYRPNAGFPWQYFYIICYYSHPVRFPYFYCFNPYGPENGVFWCRCENPYYPNYNPSFFSVLQQLNRHHNIDLCDPLFPPFVGTPAYFP